MPQCMVHKAEVAVRVIVVVAKGTEPLLVAAIVGVI